MFYCSEADIVCQGIYSYSLHQIFICHYCIFSPLVDPIISDCVDGDVRLIGGPTPLEGTVEMCRNEVWAGVCDDSWDIRDANVVCSQLGFQSTGNSTAIVIIGASITILD